MKTISDVRPSPIAGQWYPSEIKRLSTLVDGYIADAELPKLPGEVVAVIAPHAGHRYSGPVAGYSFAAVKGAAPDIVAVISPMHHPYAERILTSAHSAYATPLGEIEVDHDALNHLDLLLKEQLGLGLTRIANDPEHSLEIELPFLQRALSGPFRLLPIMMRDQGARVSEVLGNALAQLVVDQNSLLVASTDLSHFYPQHVANRLDAAILDQVAAFNPLGVIEVEERGKGFACGRGALAAVLWAARALGGDQVTILKYATSGDVSGDYSQVVGYAAAVVTRENNSLQ